MAKKQYKYYNSACSDHGNWMQPLGFEETEKLEEADVIIFGGGADIEPSTYGEEANPRTYPHPQREARERSDFALGRKLGKKFVGICRGHQLLCALAGGKLIQDVTNHSGSGHKLKTFDGMEPIVNSIHHQMINPYNMPAKDYKILAWTAERRSNYYLGSSNKRMYLPLQFKEIEAIHFPKIKGFGVQYHPEMLYSRGEKQSSGVLWTQQAFMKFFEDKL